MSNKVREHVNLINHDIDDYTLCLRERKMFGIIIEALLVRYILKFKASLSKEDAKIIFVILLIRNRSFILLKKALLALE